MRVAEKAQLLSRTDVQPVVGIGPWQQNDVRTRASAWVRRDVHMGGEDVSRKTLGDLLDQANVDSGQRVGREFEEVSQHRLGAGPASVTCVALVRQSELVDTEPVWNADLR